VSDSGSGSATRRAALRRRRRARSVGVAVVIGAVVAVAALGAVAPPKEAPPGPAGAPPTLPRGCRRAHPSEEAPEPLRSPPPFDVSATRDLAAVIHTSCGDVAVDLAEGSAPANVANFAGLADEGFYDGLPFFRIEKNSVLASGDPNGSNLDPPDGPGYEIPAAPPRRARAYVYGVVGMAGGASAGAEGSQFFIVVHDYEGARAGDPEPAGYPKDYTIIGRVRRRSWDVLQRIASVETRGGTDPVRAVEPLLPVVIDSIDVTARR
jgi:peptidyl-prolyl cis-trans isomerase B (cyclophilin B)